MRKPAMPLLHRVRARIADFADNPQGSIAVEAVLIIPLLLWALLSGYVFFDAQRVKSLNTKSAYTIADALSREASVNETYVARMGELAWLLTGARADTSMRVSVLRNTGEAYGLSWSRETGDYFSVLTQSDVDAMAAELPPSAPLDSLIVVETHMPFEPLYSNVGIPNTDLEMRVVTRPRYTPGLCWKDTTAC